MLPGRSMPLLFISATPSTCELVRKDLNLEKFRSQGLYYDLTCNDDTMKKITMLPEKMPDETKQLLTVFYGENITELDNKTANELLVKSTPKAQALQAQQSLHVSIFNSPKISMKFKKSYILIILFLEFWNIKKGLRRSQQNRQILSISIIRQR